MVRFAALLACAALPALAQPSLPERLLLPEVASGFLSPVDISHAGDGRLFVAEQAGRVWALDGEFRRAAEPFVDIRDRVLAGGERGLLGVAFHPRFAANGFVFLHYTSRTGVGRTTLSRFTADVARQRLDPASETVFFTADQPFANHNGGQLHFGPDGFLYFGLGDGGSANDPRNLGQDLTSPLGKILRLDVDHGWPARPAPGNPFLSTPGARGEIWAFGLRNPWRFSFDRATGELWIGDVGQSSREEVNWAPAGAAGLNYGWRRMEGGRCFNPQQGCNDGSLTLPVLEYAHGQGHCSVTGGYRYRGALHPELAGVYVFGDYCSGAIFLGVETGPGAFRLEGPRATGLAISTFGEDAAGEIYLADHRTGSIRRIELPRAAPSISAGGVVNAASFASGGSLAPGSIVSVFGTALATGNAAAASAPLPTTLAGARLVFDGIAAPLFFASPGQVNAQIPWELTGAPEARVQVEVAGAVSAPATVALAAAAPGIFTLDRNGAGQAAALVAGSGGAIAAPAGAFPGSRPARRGEILEVFASGLGPVATPPPTGAPAPTGAVVPILLPLAARLGGQSARALFAGLAPGLVGLYQVNIEVAEAAPPGSAVPVVLVVGGRESNSATVAVE